MNEKRRYRIEANDVNPETIWVENVRAVHSKDAERVAQEIATSDVMGEAAFLLTCDGEVLNKTGCIERIAAKKGYRLRVRNPIDYFWESWRSRK